MWGPLILLCLVLALPLTTATWIVLPYCLALSSLGCDRPGARPWYVRHANDRQTVSSVTPGNAP